MTYYDQAQMKIIEDKSRLDKTSKNKPKLSTTKKFQLVDLVLLLFVVLVGVISLVRGLGPSLIKLLSAIVALIGAKLIAPSVSGFVGGLLTSPGVMQDLIGKGINEGMPAFLVDQLMLVFTIMLVFTVIYLIATLVIRIVADMLKVVLAPGMDKILAFVCGLATGLVIIVLCSTMIVPILPSLPNEYIILITEKSAILSIVFQLLI